MKLLPDSTSVSFGRYVRGFVLGFCIAAIHFTTETGLHGAVLSTMAPQMAAQFFSTVQTNRVDMGKRLCINSYTIPDPKMKKSSVTIDKEQRPAKTNEKKTDDRSVSASPIARTALKSRCPETGLCTLNQYFDEVVVLTLPRRTRQLTRTRKQMDQLNVSHTEFVGLDKLSAVAQSIWASYIRDRVVQDLGYDTISELCVGLGWLAILDHIVNSGNERTLVLEDDVVFHREFPTEFDRRTKIIQEDWLLFFLGSSQHMWHDEGAIFPETDAPEYYNVRDTWGAFAVGVSREAAIRMLEKHRKLDCRIDICTTQVITKKHSDRCFAAYPHIAVPDVRFSDLRKGSDLAEYAKFHRWSVEMFNFDNGYKNPDRNDEFQQ
jgi:hypothetical protein